MIGIGIEGFGCICCGGDIGVDEVFFLFDVFVVRVCVRWLMMILLIVVVRMNVFGLWWV